MRSRRIDATPVSHFTHPVAVGAEAAAIAAWILGVIALGCPMVNTAAFRTVAVERLHGADQQGGGRARRLRHHVEAVVHPVDKVHVGVPRGSEHDPVPRGLAEAGVRRSVVRPEVRLDLDDTADPPPGGVVADKPGADERRTRSERQARKNGPVDDAQLNG